MRAKQFDLRLLETAESSPHLEFEGRERRVPGPGGTEVRSSRFQPRPARALRWFEAWPPLLRLAVTPFGRSLLLGVLLGLLAGVGILDLPTEARIAAAAVVIALAGALAWSAQPMGIYLAQGWQGVTVLSADQAQIGEDSGVRRAGTLEVVAAELDPGLEIAGDEGWSVPLAVGAPVQEVDRLGAGTAAPPV